MSAALRATCTIRWREPACNPASGWEKGQVEKNIQDARRRLWYPQGNPESQAGTVSLSGVTQTRRQPEIDRHPGCSGCPDRM